MSISGLARKLLGVFLGKTRADTRGRRADDVSVQDFGNGWRNFLRRVELVNGHELNVRYGSYQLGKMRNFDILAVAPDQKKPIMVYDAYLGFYTVGLVTEEQVRKLATDAGYTGVLKWTSSWPGGVTVLKAGAEAVKTEAEVKNKGASFVSMVAEAVAKASAIFCCCGLAAAADDDYYDVLASLCGTHVMIPMTKAVAKE